MATCRRVGVCVPCDVVWSTGRGGEGERESDGGMLAWATIWPTVGEGRTKGGGGRERGEEERKGEREEEANLGIVSAHQDYITTRHSQRSVYGKPHK